MASKKIEINGKSEIELLQREEILLKINQIPLDQLKRVGKLLESKKALDYLSSDIKFAGLKMFL